MLYEVITASAVRVQDAARLSQKFKPTRSRAGSTMNMSKEGITSQKIPWERTATFSGLFVSMYSHTKARIEVSGTEARAAAQKELRLATSETSTTISAVATILTRSYNFV